LSNTNESATIYILQKNLEVNKALHACKMQGQLWIGSRENNGAASASPEQKEKGKKKRKESI
jgi:hypothetical protein